MRPPGYRFQVVTKIGCRFQTPQTAWALMEHAGADTQHLLLYKTVPHPEVESVPRLLLRVDAVSLSSANSPDVSLMALFEVDELEEDRRIMILKSVM